LLQGAYDLHVHSAPDVMARKMDDLELVERFQKYGMKGFVIKSHYNSTAARAKIINKLYPNMNAVGAITLNNAVGGLNWAAVEMAARDGAKLVWMPTVDAANEQEHFKVHKPEKMPYWAALQMEMIAQGRTQSSISLLEDGKLKPSVIAILDVVAHYNMILTTGHIGKQEVFALVKAAQERKVKKIIVTHPDFPSTTLSKEEQKELANQGAYIEHCFTTPQTGKTTWEAVYEQVKYVGADKCVISTDLGQPHGMYPDEGLELFAINLLANGFSAMEVKKMFVENPTKLIEG
jgi:predicted metal-dependent TIM-barrel fold hydrolase